MDTIPDYTDGLKYYLHSTPCGVAEPVTDYSDRYLDLTQLATMGKQQQCYIFQASGDSMIDAGIEHGDIVVANAFIEPYHESIVVAAIDGEQTLKRLLLDNHGNAVLHSENSQRNYNDIILTNDMNVNIHAVVVSTIRLYTSGGMYARSRGTISYSTKRSTQS